MNVTVQELMSPEVATVGPEAPVSEVRDRLQALGISALPVVDGQTLVGIVTATDLVRDLPGAARVRDVMSRHVYTVPPYVDVHVAARVMRNHHLHHLVVTRDEQVVGVVSSYDLLRLVECHRFVAKQPGTPPKPRHVGRRRRAERDLAALRAEAAAQAQAPAAGGGGAVGFEETQRDRLDALLGHLTRRGAAVERDRSRAGGLPQDFEEQAAVRENDEVLDALSSEGLHQLDRVGEALEALDAGTYGRCADCGVEIPRARLEALPYAVTCVACAGRRERLG